MGRTKKVGVAGKYGARYGLKIRKGVANVTKRKTKKCPYCSKKQLKRLASGIWKCSKCDSKFAGGSHIPTSTEGVI